MAIVSTGAGVTTVDHQNEQAAMPKVPPPPFEVRMELPGWTLLWALLERRDGAEEALARLRDEVAAQARERHALATLATDPTVAALRRLFKQAGTDPSRYRPSSEALLRRLLKGSEIPAISPLVDLNNCLSARFAAPCCVMAEGTHEPPYRFRAGREGESYESLRGPFRLGGRPLLCDAAGPVDAPITGSQRVKVSPETRRAWLVAYLPTEAAPVERAAATLTELIDRAPVAGVSSVAATGG